MAVAYDAFNAKPSGDGWGDPVGVRSRAAADVKACVARIQAKAPGDGRIALPLFQKLALELPLLVAPAKFIFVTFEGACASRHPHSVVL